MKYIITGPGGSGKSTLAKYLSSKKGLTIAKCSTNRPPRGSDDKEYYFVDYLSYFEDTNMIAHVYNGTWGYGWHKMEVVVAGIFVAGPELALKLQNAVGKKNCMLIYLCPPKAEIKKRLAGRDMPGDTAEARMKRDAAAFRKFEKLKAYDLKVSSFPIVENDPVRQ